MAPKGRKRKVSELVETPVDPVLNVKPSPEYRHWLMKSEPDSRKENGVEMKFSFEDLKMSEGSRACWDGVRNYQARNFMRNMKIGDKAFFYHSNTKPPGIIGNCSCEITIHNFKDHLPHVYGGGIWETISFSLFLLFFFVNTLLSKLTVF